MSAGASEVIQYVDQLVHREFDSNRRVLTFEEYLSLVKEKPSQQLRASARYLVEMMDHFGQEKTHAGETHYKVFDSIPSDDSRPVIGQERAQSAIYRSLKTFSRQGTNNKLLLLHGPNGSAKTSLAHGLMGGMEKFSRTTDGAIYTFSWVFPVERYTKQGIGLSSGAHSTDRGTLRSYAKLPDDEISARLPSDLKDHPLLLIPRDQRKAFLARLVGSEAAETLWRDLPHVLSRGELNHRDRVVFDSLLTSYNGDLSRVLMHVQVERFYFSRRYRKGLVTIEPQLHVDASYQQLTMSRSLSSLPASLQSMNLFALGGDLVDGNRGLIEYSDLLKRPVDSFKYLLTACETGSVNVGASIAYLDSVLIGSTNELQLDAFKEFPDFMSFKARIDLIRVPYLLAPSQEKKIYSIDLEQIRAAKPVAPHTDWAIALWGVLTRLKKPNGVNYPPVLSSLISNLTPLEKARLYDSGDMPIGLNPEERKLLRANLSKLRDEYENTPYYEGRMGASARELKAILYSAAQNPEFTNLTPLAVLRELEEFVKRVSEYEFLKEEVKDGYGDAADLINVVRNEYLNIVDREVRNAIGLYQPTQWEDFLRKYVQQVSLALKKEKTKNPITGKMEDPDFSLIGEFENIVDAPRKDDSELASWRQNIISQVGAWSLDHSGEAVQYSKVFPEHWAKLEKHYYETQKHLLTRMHDALLQYDRDGSPRTGGPTAPAEGEGQRLAERTVENLCKNLGYTPESAREVIQFLMKSRY